MLSDHHSSYVLMRGSRSNLTRYGWFHFWINHSAYYVHEKFTFVQTASIETTWLRLKHQMMSLKRVCDFDRIDEYLNTFELNENHVILKTMISTLMSQNLGTKDAWSDSKSVWLVYAMLCLVV